MNDIRKIARVQIAMIVLFAFFKFIRPTVLESNAPHWIKTALLSLPNFFEAIIGVLVLTAIGLYLNRSVLGEKRQLKNNSIYLLATLFCGIYVITQELKIHNLGGVNVYDKNDLIFSIIGLIIGYLIMLWMKPKTTHQIVED